MKRFGLIFLGALAMIMAGCSKDVPQAPKEDAWVNDLSLPVPIEFGASGLGIQTKSDPINSLDGNMLFGIIALDVESEGVFESLPSYSAANVSSFNEGMLMPNVYATYNTDTGLLDFWPATDNSHTNVNNKQIWYYPYGSDKNFSFYAYYKRQGSGVVKAESDGFYLDVDMSDAAKQYDVLWANSEATPYGVDGITGFNARYIRAIKKDGVYDAYKPSLTFRHLTTHLKFNFQVVDNEFVSGISVDSVIVYVPSKAKLCIANKNTNLAGKLTPVDGSRKAVRLDCSNVEIQEDATTLLGNMFVCIPEEVQPDHEIGAKVYVRAPMYDPASSAPITRQVTFELVLKSEDDNGFEAGKRYEYTIKMNTPQDIDLKAELDPWGSGSASGYVNDDTISDGLLLD